MTTAQNNKVYAKTDLMLLQNEELKFNYTLFKFLKYDLIFKINLRHPSSSDPSRQSSCPSHLFKMLMHSPEVQLNWSLGHSSEGGSGCAGAKLERKS